jgi:hypothetical protein
MTTEPSNVEAVVANYWAAVLARDAAEELVRKTFWPHLNALLDAERCAEAEAWIARCPDGREKQQMLSKLAIVRSHLLSLE